MRKRDFKIVRDNANYIIDIIVKKTDFYRIEYVDDFNPYTLEYYGEAAEKCDKCGLHKYCKPYNYVYSLCEKVADTYKSICKDVTIINNTLCYLKTIEEKIN